MEDSSCSGIQTIPIYLKRYIVSPYVFNHVPYGSIGRNGKVFMIIPFYNRCLIHALIHVIPFTGMVFMHQLNWLFNFT